MPAEDDPNRAVDAFVGAIRNLASDDNYKMIADMFGDAQKLKQENARLASSSRDVLEEYRKFRNELEAKETKLMEQQSKLQQEIVTKDARIQELATSNTKLDAKFQKSRRKLDEESQKCLEFADKRKELERTSSALEASLDEKIEQASAFEGLRSTMDAELAEARGSLQLKNSELTNLEAAKIAVEGQLAEVTTTLDAKTEQLAAVEAAKATIDAQLTAAKLELEKVTKETEELAASKDTLAAELADAKRELLDKSKELEDLSALESSLDLLEVKAAVDSQLAEAKAQLEAERDFKTTAQNDLKTSTESLQKEAERTAILLDEVAHLRQNISARNQEVEKFKGEVVQSNDDLSQTQSSLKKLESIIQDLEQDLQNKTDRLDKIDTYQVQLKHEPEETSVEILDTIWVSILNLCEHHFGQDLDPQVLRDPSCWANLRSADHLRNHAVRLPLPRSNTAAAKQMRIAAVLAALTRSMARHIFRPVWWTATADANADAADAALGGLLRGLEAASPEHERHLRGTLLAASAEQPQNHGAQPAVSRRRAAAVVRELTFLVQHLLSALQYGAFREGLEACVALACEQWARVQTASMKIEPYFGPPYDDFDWQVLMLPEEGFEDNGRLGGGGGGSTLGLDAGSGTIGGSPRGVSSTAAQGAVAPSSPSSTSPRSSSTVRDPDDDESTIAESVRSVVDPADIMMVLWPTMCAVEGGELVSITQGLVMAKEQAASAFEEEGRRRPPKHNGKRARSMSQSRNGATGRPHSGKAVLAQAKRERDDGSAGRNSRNGSRNGSLNAVD
ncbi:hypothetical protein F5883DRAFT_480667 [Diaporthe sp. PMI_573]|nr:hypothetical protein F5883DRAFT_480667 [Diaporthaceae sp. PMI_573]